MLIVLVAMGLVVVAVVAAVAAVAIVGGQVWVRRFIRVSLTAWLDSARFEVLLDRPGGFIASKLWIPSG
jgi:hypothetical protein